MNGWGRALRIAALAGCMAVLGAAAVWAWIVFAEESSSFVSLPFAALAVSVFVWAGKALGRARKRALRRLFPAAVWGMAALYLGVSFWFMHAYRYVPVWDPDAVFTGAQSWLAGSLTEISTPTYDASTYFYYFPNNLGAALVMRCWFAAVRALDPYIAACLLNSLLSAGMILCTGYAAKETGGERAGLMALLILGCTLPIWFSSAAFYTDFLSICFPVGSLLFALKAEKCGSIRIRAAFWALSGLMAAVGAMIKITVLIMPIALVLWQALRGRWKAALAIALAAGILFGAGQIVLRESVYPDQLDPQIAAQRNTPVQHWIMMGLRGDGYYNGEDYAFTRSFADAREAKNAIGAVIGGRIAEYGPGGLLEHLVRKMGICISDGTLMLSDYYDDSPAGPNWCMELLLPGGRLYGLWKAICGGVHMAQILLCIAGAARQIRRGGRGLSGAMYTSLLGLLLFLSMWETSKRYWINFLPVLVLCAAQGAAMRRAGEKQMVKSARG